MVFLIGQREHVLKNAEITATVVGVADTTAVYDYEGQVDKFVIEDAFFFSKTALDDMRKQAGIVKDEANFLIRAKTPADMIALKDEINKLGISPLGRFELVEDMVRLQNQTSEQSGTANIIIALLSVILVVAVFLITSALRKREYVIYKVSGFNLKDLCLLNLAESISLFIGSAASFLILSPLFNLAVKNIFGMSILKANLLFTGVLLTLVLSVIAYIITVIISIKTNPILSPLVGEPLLLSAKVTQKHF